MPVITTPMMHPYSRPGPITDAAEPMCAPPGDTPVTPQAAAAPSRKTHSRRAVSPTRMIKKRRWALLSVPILLSIASRSSVAATILWTGGGDTSGLWTGTTFNTQAYTSLDDLNIDGSATKTITLIGALTPNSLTVSGTGTTGATVSGGVGAAGAGAITLTGTSVGGTLSKTGSADLVLASANTFGNVTISNGKFFLNNAAGLGTTGTLTVNSGTASGVSGSYAAATEGQFYYDSSGIN